MSRNERNGSGTKGPVDHQPFPADSGASGQEPDKEAMRMRKHVATWGAVGLLVVVGALHVAAVRYVPPNVLPPPPFPRVPASIEVISRATAEAQALGSSLLWCRQRRAQEVCRKPNVDPMDCWSARTAILGDGVFDQLKALREDRSEQRRVAAEALNRCLGAGGDPELGRMLGIPLASCLDCEEPSR